MMTQGIARAMKPAGFFGFPIHAWFAALLLALSVQSAVAEKITIECEDFKMVQKGDDAQDSKASKYPILGQARDGASGGKTTVFKQVMKTAKTMPYIETPVTIPQPGDWFLWVSGQCRKPMKPGTLVVLVNQQPAGDLQFPQDSWGWKSIKLAGFSGGSLRIQRNGGDGYLDLDCVILTQDPQYKPAPEASATSGARTPREKSTKSTNEGDPEEKTASVAQGIAKRKNAPIAITAQMTADGQAAPNFMASPGQAIKFDLEITTLQKKNQTFDFTIRVTDLWDKTVQEVAFAATADAEGKFKHTLNVTKSDVPTYGLLRFFVGDQELRPDPFFAVSYAVTDPAVKSDKLDADSPYGVCAHYSDSPVMLDALQRVGIKWVRNTHVARWGSVEPQQGQFDFAEVKDWLRLLRQHGMLRLERLDRAPVWARGAIGGDKGPPRDLAEWKTYVGTTVRELAEFKPHYEVWNEPDLKHFWEGTAEQYVQLLNAAYEAAKAADPNCVVVMAGVTSGFSNPQEKPDRRAFTETVLRSGKFDVGCAHVYDTVAAAENAFKEFRTLMAQNGHQEKPVYFSEMGKHTWHALKSSVKEPVQAQWHVKKVVIGLSCGINKFFHFNSISDPDTMPFDHGMMRTNFAPKPIMVAQAALAQWLHNGKFVREVSLSPDVRAFEFNNAGQAVTVIWTAAGKQEIPLTVVSTANLTVCNVLGAPMTVPRQGNVYRLTVGDYPIYVIGGALSADGAGSGT